LAANTVACQAKKLGNQAAESPSAAENLTNAGTSLFARLKLGG
jgi:hypothetical protein